MSGFDNWISSPRNTGKLFAHGKGTKDKDIFTGDNNLNRSGTLSIS